MGKAAEEFFAWKQAYWHSDSNEASLLISGLKPILDSLAVEAQLLNVSNSDVIDASGSMLKLMMAHQNGNVDTFDGMMDKCWAVAKGIRIAEATPKPAKPQQTITLRELHTLCKLHSSKPKIATVQGWSRQQGFPVAISGNKDKTYPKQDVSDWVRDNKGINIY